MLDAYKIETFLNMQWLRPENVILDAVAAKLIGDELLQEQNILEIGIGNGIFTYIVLGGQFNKSFDWFYNIDAEASGDDKDIYDFNPKINIMGYVEVPPKKRVMLAVEHKKNLIAQAKQLNFVNEFLCQDANIPFEFHDINIVYTNILHWLQDPITILKKLDKQLSSGGKILLVFPNNNFLKHCQSYEKQYSFMENH